jgi:hypothetical protein
LRLELCFYNNNFKLKNIMANKITPQQNQSNQSNANKGTSGTNRQYSQKQGNRGTQMNPNQGGKRK